MGRGLLDAPWRISAWRDELTDLLCYCLAVSSHILRMAYAEVDSLVKEGGFVCH